MAESKNKKRKSSEADKDDVAPMATETNEMSLKLAVDGGSKKVLYAEAKKDFIDFLFGLLQLPIGSIMALLAENGFQVSGSLGRVLKIVSDLKTSDFHSSEIKDALLKPKVFSVQARDVFNPPLLLQEFASWKTLKAYGKYYDAGPHPAKVEGFVKAENNAYMVMDDLVVSPMSTISVFALLKKFKIKDLSLLEEKIVKIDLNKGLALVKASMESDTALTDFFTSQSQATKMEEAS